MSSNPRNPPHQPSCPAQTDSPCDRWIMIDNYDSFTYNLVQRFGELGIVGMEVWRHDAITVEQLRRRQPRALIISPGPNAPAQAGVSMAAIEAFMGQVPIFGVCLGHQAIVEVLGGKVVRAPRVMHGRTSDVYHDGKGLHAGISNPFVATRYHSLMAQTQSLPQDLIQTAWTQDGIIMGARHKTMALYGVQYHPEAILTVEGLGIMRNFANLVDAFHLDR